MGEKELEEIVKRFEIDMKGPTMKEIGDKRTARETIQKWYATQKVNIALARIMSPNKENVAAIEEKIENLYQQIKSYAAGPDFY